MYQCTSISCGTVNILVPKFAHNPVDNEPRGCSTKLEGRQMLSVYWIATRTNDGFIFTLVAYAGCAHQVLAAQELDWLSGNGVANLAGEVIKMWCGKKVLQRKFTVHIFVCV